MSQNNDIDAARAEIESTINMIGDEIPARLAFVDDAYSSVTGLLDSAVVWYNKPNDVFPGAWQVISFYNELLALLDTSDELYGVIQSYLTAAESAAESEYLQSTAGIIEGTVTETASDIADIAGNIKDTIENATKPPVIALIVAAIIAIFALTR